MKIFNSQKNANLGLSSKDNYTKPVLLATLLTTALVSTSTVAYENNLAKEITVVERKQEKTKNENIGFGSGAIIGGVIAGPLGAMVAGIGGTLIAKFINLNDDNDALTAALVEEKQLYTLNYEKAEKQYQAKYNRLHSTYQQQLASFESQQHDKSQLQANNLLMSLQFSTGSSDIAHHYNEQVSTLANLLNSSPDLKIDLSGYTDLTGETTLNHTLSKARVESVKALLMAKGVDEQQIATFAFGENAPVVANNQQKVSFYDRRVVMKLHKSPEVEENQMAANN